MESENIFNKYCTKSLAKIKSSVITSLGNNDDSAIKGCIEYNSAFKVKDWNDDLLIELGKVWDKNDFELVDLTNESYTVELKGLPAIAIPGIFNPFLEYKNYDGQLYVKCSEKINAATLAHVNNNAHHPEHWLKEKLTSFDRTNPQMNLDCTAMPEDALTEMCADWCAMSEEFGNTPFEWMDKTVPSRWVFNDKQKEFMKETLNKMWEE